MGGWAVGLVEAGISRSARLLRAVDDEWRSSTRFSLDGRCCNAGRGLCLATPPTPARLRALLLRARCLMGPRMLVGDGSACEGGITLRCEEGEE